MYGDLDKKDTAVDTRTGIVVVTPQDIALVTADGSACPEGENAASQAVWTMPSLKTAGEALRQRRAWLFGEKKCSAMSAGVRA